MGLIEIICTPFSYIVSAVNTWTGSYLLALLAFTIVMKLVFFPLAVKQQKNSVRQAKLKPKEEAIRAKYAGRTDKPTQQKMQNEIMEMYQAEKFSPLSGCLPLLIQLPLLLILYNIVRYPLSYTVRYNQEEITALNTAVAIHDFYDVRSGSEGAVGGDFKLEAQGDGTYVFYDPALGKDFLVKENAQEKLLQFYEFHEDGTAAEKPVRFLKSDRYTFAASDTAENDAVAGIPSYPVNDARGVQKEQSALVSQLKREPELYTGIYSTVTEGKEGSFATAEELDLEGRLPQFSLFGGAIDLGERPTVALDWMISIPILVFVTSYLTQWLTRKFTYQPQAAESQSSMRLMNIIMPLFSLWISFNVPCALAIYWILQNIISPIQQIAVSKMYPVPTFSPEELKKAKDEYMNRQKGKTEKKSVPAPKRRSLVYDDDEDEAEEPEVSEKPVEKPKKDAGEQDSPIGKAELK